MAAVLYETASSKPALRVGATSSGPHSLVPPRPGAVGNGEMRSSRSRTRSRLCVEELSHAPDRAEVIPDLVRQGERHLAERGEPLALPDLVAIVSRQDDSNALRAQRIGPSRSASP